MTPAAKRNEPLEDGRVREASKTCSGANPEADEYLATVEQTMDEWNSKEDETAWRDL